MLKQLTVFSLLAILSHGYSVFDQRQDGRINVHAQLDNIMIVIATPGDKGPSSLFNDIASQILELRGLNSRNKKVSVADEEILEEGQDPLNVKILRIEDNAADHHESPAPSIKSSIQNHRKLFQVPKIEDIKVHIDESHLPKKEPVEKKISLENQQIIDKLGISGKLHSHKSEVHSHKSEVHSQHSHENDEKKSHVKEAEKLKTEKIESTENKDSPQEKTPEKFISFGTISSIDGKVVYISEKKQTAANFDQLPEKQDNHQTVLLKENQPNSAQQEIPLETKIDGEKSKVEDQSDKSQSATGKQIRSETDEKIIRKIRRLARHLQNSLKEPLHQKSRKTSKKELPRFEEHKVDAGDQNQVRLIADQKAQFLKPVGEMIENCGPGRVRNRYGICQFDESFN